MSDWQPCDPAREDQRMVVNLCPVLEIKDDYEDHLMQDPDHDWERSDVAARWQPNVGWTSPNNWHHMEVTA